MTHQHLEMRETSHLLDLIMAAELTEADLVEMMLMIIIVIIDLVIYIF